MGDDKKIKRDSPEIARGNDALRKTCATSKLGQVIITSNLAAHQRIGQIMEAVSSFDDFCADNDPYGEHDCAVLTAFGEKVMFKIDYYDSSLEWGANPYEDDDFVRVMTVMYPNER